MTSLLNDGTISMARIEVCKLQVPNIEAKEVQPVDRLSNFNFKAFLKAGEELKEEVQFLLVVLSFP